MPRHTPRKALAELLEPYINKDHFLTFTDLSKVGINPNNKFKTPLGVYCYPIAEVIEEIADGNFMFGIDRKHYHVLKQTTTKILDLSNYKIAQFEADFDALYAYTKKSGKHIAPLIAKAHECALYAVKNVGSLFWGLIQACVQIESEKIGRLATERSTVLWNKLLREMGYDLVVDRSSNIHLLQSAQAIFLSPRAYKVVHSGLVPKAIGKARADYWGGALQPYWHPGANPTVDMVIVADGERAKQILLIKRAKNAKAEAGKWALPGGFIDTNAPRGMPWQPDRESLLQAAVRETAEETGIYLSSMGAEFQLVGVFEGGGRDPRDNREAWVRSTAVAIDLKARKVKAPKGRDDADEARWIPICDLQKITLAFDHSKIVKRGLKILGLG